MISALYIIFLLMHYKFNRVYLYQHSVACSSNQFCNLRNSDKSSLFCMYILLEFIMQMLYIFFGVIFYTEFINTQSKQYFCTHAFIFPEIPEFVGNRQISIVLIFLISENCSLFQSVHTFINLYVYISIMYHCLQIVLGNNTLQKVFN